MCGNAFRKKKKGLGTRLAVLLKWKSFLQYLSVAHRVATKDTRLTSTDKYTPTHTKSKYDHTIQCNRWTEFAAQGYGFPRECAQTRFST